MPDWNRSSASIRKKTDRNAGKAPQTTRTTSPLRTAPTNPKFRKNKTPEALNHHRILNNTSAAARSHLQAGSEPLAAQRGRLLACFSTTSAPLQTARGTGGSVVPQPSARWQEGLPAWGRRRQYKRRALVNRSLVAVNSSGFVRAIARRKTTPRPLFLTTKYILEKRRKNESSAHRAAGEG